MELSCSEFDLSRIKHSGKDYLFQQKFVLKKVDLSKEQILRWASLFEQFIYLNHNNILYPHGGFPEVLAAGSKRKLEKVVQSPFEELFEFHKKRPSWLFGFFTYDLKNYLEKLESKNHSHVEFPELFFFEPELLFFFEEESITILSDVPIDSLIDKIKKELATIQKENFYSSTSSELRLTTSKEEYLNNVDKIRQHIIKGDVYELNYCIELLCNNFFIDPINFYKDFCEVSPTPFSSLLKVNNKYLISASPERFIRKIGANVVISQPMKGTAARSPDHDIDKKQKELLKSSEKERAENMMIVDLVRNDLAKSSIPGTIKVEEIFGVYSFEQVHQMISTVQSEVRNTTPFTNIIRDAFPMGSMTGAPKISAMQLIDTFENFKRNLFSGSLGFITPEGGFDFNVVIRSALYDSKTATFSFPIGSAITYDSNPNEEYEECLLKAKFLLEIISHTGPTR